MNYKTFMELQGDIQSLENLVSTYEFYIKFMEETGDRFYVLGIGYNVVFDFGEQKQVNDGVMYLDPERGISKKHIINGLKEVLEVTKNELESLKRVCDRAKVTV